MTDEITPPLCASCEFGHCVQQTMPMENVTVIAPGQEREEWEPEPEEEEAEGVTAMPSILAYSAICWWHPANEVLQQPFEMMHVKACSRWKQREDLKDEEPIPKEE